MKTFTFMREIFLVIIVTISMSNVLSQSIPIDSTFTTDGVIYPFNPGDTIYGLSITGNITLNSDTSLVRIIVHSNKGEFMILEAYSMIAIQNEYSVTDHCDETCYLDGVTVDSIRIEIIDATITIDTFTFTTGFIENATLLQYESKLSSDSAKIETMNSNIKKYGLNWVAGDRNSVHRFYEQRKARWGNKYNLMGYDYYIGGVFEEPGKTYAEVTSNSYVNIFDWRSRHGANIMQSPYFDGDDSTWSGWLTIAKDQGNCGSCAIFADVGVTESIINLYFNQHLDYDLSEQQVISCYINPQYNCEAGWDPKDVFDYIQDSGLVTEDCFPYQGTDTISCDTCSLADTIANINSFHSYPDPPAWLDIEDIQELLVEYGPIAWKIKVGNNYHMVTLVGWNYIEGSDEMLLIYKDSDGYEGSYGGFVTGIAPAALLQVIALDSIIPVTIISSDTLEVQCKDEDGDGYYFWGIGEKPSWCNCPSIPDCDDSNPALGPYGNDFSCECIAEWFPDDSIIITSNITWDSIIKVEYPIIIDSGGQLTVESIAYMHPNGYIIVKPGGRLIIDGGKITKACNELWQGIQVWGDSSETQYYLSEHGYLEVKNAGRIEYAQTGVFVGRIDEQDTLYEYSGGIVKGSSSIFMNNEVDIEFLPYKNIHPYGGYEVNNLSGFRNCSFITHDPDLILDTNIVHVILAEVTGIGFNGCTFQRVISDFLTPKPDHLGTGILAYDAGIWCDGLCRNYSTPCNDIDSNTFENLRYGIKAFNTGGYKTFHINHNQFINNIAGMYISGYTQAFIARSLFRLKSIGFFNINNLNEKFYGGIYMEGCTGYHIENNVFLGDLVMLGAPPTVCSEIGIYVKNSGEEDNEIYNNTFIDTHAGIIAEGVNKGDRTGLCLKCNEYTHNINDMIVWPNPLLDGKYKDIGIKETQGADTMLTTALAGNTFTHMIQGTYTFQGDTANGYYLYFNYHNSAEYFTYYHHRQQEYPLTYPKEDNYTQETIDLVEKSTIEFIKDDACPSGLGGNHYKSGSNPRLDIAEADNHIAVYSSQLSALVDGGDTDGLNFEVIMSMPDEALETRQELLNESPYLSDTVMKQAIYQENVLPNAMVRDVLIANPQSAKSDDVLGALDERFNPMPDYMMAEIMQGRSIIGAKESLESRLSYWEQFRSRAVNQLVREFITDTTILNPLDSLLAFYQDESGLHSRYRLAFVYADKGMIDDATGMVAGIPSGFELTAYENAVWQDFSDLFAVFKTINDSNWNARQLDSIRVYTLMNIMNNAYPMVSDYARGLLIKGRHISYTEAIATPDNSKSFPYYYYLSPEAAEFPEEEHLHLFPNPAGDYVIVYHNTTELAGEAMLKIYNLNGVLLKTVDLESYQNQLTLDLKEFSNGVYILGLYVNNKFIESKKLTKGRD